MSDDWVRAQVDGLRRRVEELEARVGELDGRTSSASAFEASMDAQIVGLLRAGRKIEAIKLHRERTGLGLAEAKAEVDRMSASI